VNSSKVTVTDLKASNGIIHVIDAVLMPPAKMGMPTANIVETAVANGGFTKLVAALQAAGLDSVLANEAETFTVFAPTDAAFAMIGEDNLNKLLADKTALTDLLLQHVVSGVQADSITAFTLNGTNLKTAGGADIPVKIIDGKLTVGGANVIIKDIYTSNGVIHVIDTVITGTLSLPMSIVEVATKAGGFTTLLAALEAADLTALLDDLDGTFTVFAPTDAAFAALGDEAVAALLADPEALANVLKYHVISGSSVMASAAIGVANSDNPFVAMANGDKVALSTSGESLLVNTSTVTSANVAASNGVIHVIDKVLMPPADVTVSTSNIVETAIAAGSFTTLVTALQATGLDATLTDETTTFTVFAPTDAAFALLGQATINALLADIEALKKILLQHVIAGAKIDALTAYSSNGASVTTAGGASVPIAIVDGNLTVGGATVTTADIYTNNGIIHVIDAVIVDAE
jgi:transforming growth factor-beta-induced protein